MNIGNQLDHRRAQLDRAAKYSPSEVSAKRVAEPIVSIRFGYPFPSRSFEERFAGDNEMNLDLILADVKNSFRNSVRRPWFWLAATICLGLGLGVNTSIFAVVRGVLLRPLPYPDVERLVVPTRLLYRDPDSPAKREGIAGSQYLDWKGATGFDYFEAIGPRRDMNFSGEDRPLIVKVRSGTPGLLRALGTQTKTGRFFLPDDGQTGAEVAVLSHGLALRVFGGGREALGKEFSLEGRLHRVIGVLPSGWSFLYEPIDVWVPLALRTESQRRLPLTIVAKLSAEDGQLAAAARLDATFQRQEGSYPARIVLDTLTRFFRERRGGPDEARRGLLVLMVTVLVVSFIAVSGVSLLFLDRSSDRYLETSVRAALGARRYEIMRSLFLEALPSTLAAALLGTTVSFWGVGIVRGFSFISAIQYPIEVDASVLVVSAITALVFGFVLSVAPAVIFSKVNPSACLQERVAAGGRKSFSEAVIVAQVAVAVMLLIGAGLMFQSFSQLSRIDVGFDPDQVLLVTLRLSRSDYVEEAEEGLDPVISPRQLTLAEDIRDRIRALPGVRDAGLASGLYTRSVVQANVDGQGNGDSRGQSVFYLTADRSYLEALGIRRTRGAHFAENAVERRRSVLLNQTAADRLWKEGPAPRLSIGGWDGEPDVRQVVGVVADSRLEDIEKRPPPMVIFPYDYPVEMPVLDLARLQFLLAIKTEVSPTTLLESVRSAIREVAPSQPLVEMTTMNRRLADQQGERRLHLNALVILGGIAILLTSSGIWGIVSLLLRRQSFEIAVRIAMGSPLKTIVRGLIFRTLLLATVGSLVGCAAGYGLARLLHSQLYGVETWDVPTYAGAMGLTLLLVGVVAVAPTRRIWKSEPWTILKGHP